MSEYVLSSIMHIIRAKENSMFCILYQIFFFCISVLHLKFKIFIFFVLFCFCFVSSFLSLRNISTIYLSLSPYLTFLSSVSVDVPDLPVWMRTLILVCLHIREYSNKKYFNKVIPFYHINLKARITFSQLLVVFKYFLS